MTDTRKRGFKNRAEIEEHLAEIFDDPLEVVPGGDKQVDLQDLEREAAWLRKEVSDLRAQLHVTLGGDQGDQAKRSASRRYLRWALVFTIAATALRWRT